MKYKLIQKMYLNKREEVPLLYAIPIMGEAEEVDSAILAATVNTTMVPIRLTVVTKKTRWVDTDLIHYTLNL